MKLATVGFWATPKSQEELNDMVEGLNSPEAIHAMMFTWNYIAYMMELEDGNDKADTAGCDNHTCPVCGHTYDD